MKNLDKGLLIGLRHVCPTFVGVNYRNDIRIPEKFEQIAYIVLDIDRLPTKEVHQEKVDAFTNPMAVNVLSAIRN